MRREFRERFRVLILVDEFQDTDPLQAELLLLSRRRRRAARLRPGALFIVGDPKQSIYRFRRADVGAYRRIADGSADDAAPSAVTLQTSFRSVPAIQHFVNAAFRRRDERRPRLAAGRLRAAARASGRITEQPSVWRCRCRGRTAGSLWPAAGHADGAQPIAAAGDRGVHRVDAVAVSARGRLTARRRRKRIVASDICLLFRRFVHFGDDITREYVEALEARGIPHLLVGGKTFHEREEVDAIRTALTAIEWPEDELSVYATLHGPLFAIGEEELLEYHSIAQVFHPYRVPAALPERLQPIAQGAGRAHATCMPRAIIGRSPTRSAA